jgi:hypothetical protein
VKSTLASRGAGASDVMCRDVPKVEAVGAAERNGGVGCGGKTTCWVSGSSCARKWLDCPVTQHFFLKKKTG